MTISIVRLIPATMLLVAAMSIAARPEEKTGTPEPSGCRDSVDVCVAKKRDDWKNRGTLGIAFNSPQRDATGGVRWEIAGVLDDSAAADAGLARGDIVLKWNGEVPGEPDFDKRWVESIRVGDEIELEVRRDGENRTFKLIGRAPDARTMEFWLAYYVFENFGKEEYEAYLKEVMPKLAI